MALDIFARALLRLAYARRIVSAMTSGSSDRGGWARRCLLAAVVMTVLASCSLPHSMGTPSSSTTASTPDAPVQAGGGLPHPRVAALAPDRGRYNRDDWQPHGWSDADGNGCNTRAEVLLVEATGPVVRGSGCKIVSGQWQDPYTGRHTTSPAALQIDHLVALSDASASGGWAWPPERKVAFANDLADADELNAVWGPENQRKSDYGPDGWLPPASGFRCAYVAAYARIKAHWDLTVTPQQWAAIEHVWASCGPTQP